MTYVKKYYLNSQRFQSEKQTQLMYTNNTIWRAIFNTDESAINEFLANDPTVLYQRGAVGECPIHMLFLYGTDAHIKIAQDLLIRFPMIATQIYDKPRYYGENILHIAIVKRNPTIVEWLLSQKELEPYRKELLTARAIGDFFKIGEPSYFGETPLGFACCTNQWDLVEILLKHGADIDSTDSNGNTILHMLVICNLPDMYTKFKAHWIEEYKKKNNKIDTKCTSSEYSKLWNRLNNDGLTPLTLAADLGRIKMLSWLLEERTIVQWSYGNVSCVLHPLDQLDLGFQEKNVKRPLSVLEIIVKNNNAELINPIVTALIYKKWKYFAYRILIKRFIITLTYLLVFLATTIGDRTPSKVASDANTGKLATKYKFTRWNYHDLGHFIVLTGAVLKSARELSEMYTMGFINYARTTGSIFLENVLSSIFCICILTNEVCRAFEIHEHERLILALASLVGWSYLFFFTMPFRFTGPFVIMIYKMLFNDVLRFCIIYLIFLAGFSQSFFILFNENGVHGYILSIKQCFLGLLGDFNLDYYIEVPYPLATIALAILYIVVITILLLNLLIAMMGDTYADVKKSAKALWHLERARIALDIESGMSTNKRGLEKNKYWFELVGERYLQVEQVIYDRAYFKDDETDDECL